MTKYYSNCITLKGQEHKRINLPCQDRSGYLTEDDMSILVVSDGHGAEYCFRSDSGAEFAVESAIEVVTNYLKSNKANLMERAVILRDRKLTEDIAKSIEIQILNRWKEKIKEDLDENPFSLDEENLQKTNKTDIDAYGATLIVAGFWKNLCFGFQIGDGHLFSINSSGYINSRVVREDPNCSGNFTTSLCDTNSIDSFRHFIKDSGDWVGFAACSDGLENSVDDISDCEKLVRAVSSTLDYSEGINRDIYCQLSDLTEKGNKDDISFAITCSCQANYPLFESLVEHRIPEYDHGSRDFQPTLKIIHDCVFDSKDNLLEQGIISSNNFYYFGNFINSKLSSGKIRYPDVQSDLEICNKVVPPKSGLFWSGLINGGKPNYAEGQLISIDDAGKTIFKNLKFINEELGSEETTGDSDEEKERM